MKQTIYLIAVCLMFPAFALAAGAGEPDAAGLQAIQGGSRSVTYKGRVVDERSSVPLAGVAIEPMPCHIRKDSNRVRARYPTTGLSGFYDRVVL